MCYEIFILYLQIMCHLRINLSCLTLLLLLLFALPAAGKKRTTEPLDSLLQKLYAQAPSHDQLVRHYESELYVKGVDRPVKLNRMIQSVPQLMRFDKDVESYIFESYSELNYTWPFIFDRKVLAVNGTFPRMRKESDNLIQYFNVSLYKETIIGNHLLSPFLKQNARFYRYQLDSIRGELAFISFEPKYKNTQVMDGRFVLNTRYNTVSETELNGFFEFMKFNLHVYMGKAGYEMVLPVRYELKYTFTYVGSQIEGDYISVQRYNIVDLSVQPRPRKKHHHDITDRYQLQVDTAEYHQDSLMIARHRMLPLLPEEQQIYERHAFITDSIAKLNKPPLRASTRFWRKFGEAMVADFGWRFNNNEERIKFSSILNPVLLEYSKSRGYNYRIDMRYTSDKPSGRSLRLSPRIGYNFSFKEWNGRVNLRYLYWPKISGFMWIEAGSGRRVYTDAVQNEVKKAAPYLDSLSLSKLHVDVFTDHYLEVKNRFEIVNGLDLTTGFTWRRRVQTKPSEIQIKDVPIKDHYSSFAVNARLDWTPGQYYYWERNRKVDVYSPFPTFSLDWEHGFPNIFGSNGMYERWEFEMNYSYKTNVLNRIYYQLGAGIFSKQSTIWFADFYNFRHSHVPEGWWDDLSGTFQTLNRSWYNSADRYLRGHITYETPLLALTRLHKITHAIQAERLYFGALMMPQLHPYLEFGWGFATHVFDCGFYVSTMNGKFNNVGVEFEFELFRRNK